MSDDNLSLILERLKWIGVLKENSKGDLMSVEQPKPEPLALPSTEPITNPVKSETEFVTKSAEESDIAFDKKAKAKGYILKPKEKAMWEILMSIAWITWISMCIAFTLRYMSLATATGIFIFNWLTFMPYLYEVGIGFTTVVLGQATKLLNQWYEQRQKQIDLKIE